jgi:hypothetical protein
VTTSANIVPLTLPHHDTSREIHLVLRYSSIYYWLRLLPLQGSMLFGYEIRSVVTLNIITSDFCIVTFNGKTEYYDFFSKLKTVI